MLASSSARIRALRKTTRPASSCRVFSSAPQRGPDGEDIGILTRLSSAFRNALGLRPEESSTTSEDARKQKPSEFLVKVLGQKQVAGTPSKSTIRRRRKKMKAASPRQPSPRATVVDPSLFEVKNVSGSSSGEGSKPDKRVRESISSRHSSAFMNKFRRQGNRQQGNQVGEVPNPSSSNSGSGKRGSPSSSADKGSRGGEDAASLVNLTFTRLNVSEMPAHHPVVPKEIEHIKVPPLAKELRVALREPGIHTCRDLDYPDTSFFSEYFQKIRQPSELDMDRITPYHSASRDPLLIDYTKRLLEGRSASTPAVCTSTSSCTPLMSQIIFAFTNFKSVNLQGFSPVFTTFPQNFTRATRKPAMCVLRRRSDGVWGLDGCPTPDPGPGNILMHLGKTMERMLTDEPDEFESVFLKGSDKYSELYDIPPREPAVFVKMGDTVVVRSQLDAIATKKDREFTNFGSGVVDIKTRATNPIRLDIKNYNRYFDYHLNTLKGAYFSFEREWFDMSRSAFIKYQLQCRLGGMDGVFLAYHNTEQVFGYEYIPVEKIEKTLYGSKAMADTSFSVSTQMMDKILSQVLDRFHDTDTNALRLLVHANYETHDIDLFVEIVDTEEEHNDLVETFKEERITHYQDSSLQSRIVNLMSASDEDIEQQFSTMEDKLKKKLPILNKKEKITNSYNRDIFPDPVMRLLQVDLFTKDELITRLKEFKEDYNPSGKTREILSQEYERLLSSSLDVELPAIQYYQNLVVKEKLFRYKIKLATIVNGDLLTRPFHVSLFIVIFSFIYFSLFVVL